MGWAKTLRPLKHKIMTKAISMIIPLSVLSFYLAFTDVAQVNLSPLQNHNDVKVSFQQDAPFTPEQMEKAKQIIANVSAEDKSAVKIKPIYNKFCAVCHGLKGDMEMNGSKKLSESTLTLEQSVARINFGGGMMTAFEELLTEAEIVSMAEFIESEFRK